MSRFVSQDLDPNFVNLFPVDHFHINTSNFSCNINFCELKIIYCEANFAENYPADVIMKLA